MGHKNGSLLTLLPVLNLIEKMGAENMEVHPFILWTKKLDMTPREQLISWLPSITIFAMEFKDFNNIILKYPQSEATIDSLKAAINEHATEDGTHWSFLMEDIQTLNANVTLDAVSFFKNVWGDEIQIQRSAFYDLVVLAHEAKDPILRYCLIAAFEKCGGIIFSAMTEIGNRFTAETGKELLYLGQTHLETENGHLQYSPNKIDEGKFWNQEINSDTLKEALRIVNRVFDINMQCWSGYLDFVENNAKNIFKNMV